MRRVAGMVAVLLVLVSSGAGSAASVNDQIVDLSLVDAQRGSALVAHPCRRDGQDAGCAALFATVDGGERWSAVAVPASFRAAYAAGSTRLLRRAARTGYLFGARPLMMAASQATLFRLAYTHDGCPAQCGVRRQRSADGIAWTGVRGWHG